MWDTFAGAVSFDQPLLFDVGSVTKMDFMLSNADDFNQQVSFDTGRVTDMNSMFKDADVFNQPLTFNVSSVTNMGNIFYGANALSNCNKWVIDDSFSASTLWPAAGDGILVFPHSNVLTERVTDRVSERVAERVPKRSA